MHFVFSIICILYNMHFVWYLYDMHFELRSQCTEPPPPFTIQFQLLSMDITARPKCAIIRWWINPNPLQCDYKQFPQYDINYNCSFTSSICEKPNAIVQLDDIKIQFWWEWLLKHFKLSGSWSMLHRINLLNFDIRQLCPLSSRLCLSVFFFIFFEVHRVIFLQFVGQLAFWRRRL